MRDAGAVTAHRITYEGPAALAVQAATLIADATGIELTSANSPEPLDGRPDVVRLALEVEGTEDDVVAAVSAVGAGLPDGAGLALGPA